MIMRAASALTCTTAINPLFSLLFLGQSGSINRYLASLVKNKPGFYPSDAAELAYCDMIHETAQDIAQINPIVNMFSGDTFAGKKSEYFQV